MSCGLISDLQVLLACESARQRKQQDLPLATASAVLLETTGQSMPTCLHSLERARQHALIGFLVPHRIWIEETGAGMLLDHFRQLPELDDFGTEALRCFCTRARCYGYQRTEEFEREAERRGLFAA